MALVKKKNDHLIANYPIIRAAKSPSIKAFYFYNWEHLKNLIDVKNLTKACIFADLSLGSWKGHWVANELCRQLNIDLPNTNIQPILGSTKNNNFTTTNIIGQLIDNESSGDKNFKNAYRFTTKIINQVALKKIKWIFIIAPLDGNYWGLENIYLIYLLSYRSCSWPYQISILLSKNGQLPSTKKINIDLQNKPCVSHAVKSTPNSTAAIPGIIDPSAWNTAMEYSNENLLLNNGHVIIDPNQRSKTISNFSVKDLKKTATQTHILAYLELHDKHQNVNFLQKEAGIRFAEGAYEVAMHILSKIQKSGLHSSQLAAIAIQQQTINIALMHFEKAAQGPLPSDDLPAQFKAFLYQSKAWGLVMTNKPKAAAPLFEQARQHLDPNAHPSLYLYLLNISALNKMKLGDIEAAFSLQKTIEQQLKSMPNTDWHITYINCINQARLYKRQKKFEQAINYYQKAFAINYQLKNESDLLYTNLCFAQLATFMGDNTQSLVYWIRVCMHWLSNPLPETLAHRVMQAILAQPLSHRTGNVEQISAALRKHLLHAAINNKITFKPFIKPIPFARVSLQYKPIMGMGNDGWLVYGSQQKLPLIYTGNHYEALNKNLLGILSAFLPTCNLVDYNCFLTDTQNGIELPANSSAFFWSCLKWHVTHLIYKEQCYDISLEKNSTYIKDYKIGISPSIHFIEKNNQNWVVYFKRYKVPLKLDQEEKKLLEILLEQQNCNIKNLQNLLKKGLSSLIEWLHMLEKKSIITIIFFS